MYLYDPSRVCRKALRSNEVGVDVDATATAATTVYEDDADDA